MNTLFLGLLHYIKLVAPQIHSFASAMVALCFVMFCITSLIAGGRSLLGKEPGQTWRFFFSGIVGFGLLWALVPA
jgi:hypothetical protein